MFITKEKLDKIVDEKIEKAFENWGFKKESSWIGYPFFPMSFKKYPHTKLLNQFEALLKHLGLKYFKKEIKETNGDKREYIQEGFRKIKKVKGRGK